MAPASAPHRGRSPRVFLSLLARAARLVLPGRAGRPSPFQLQRLRAELPALTAPLRIAFLADLHFGVNVGMPALTPWVDAALAEAPDLVLLGGDLVDRTAAEVDDLVAELERLHAPLGVYAVWGNNDHERFRDLQRFAGALQAAGVRVLDNRGVRLRDDLYLAGIDDLTRGRPDPGAALDGRPPGTATLLLAHNPDVLPELPPGVDLTLCGHTHGGQICLPLIGPVVTGSHYGRRFAHGWVSARPRGDAVSGNERANRGYVSRGLGTSTLPFRLACPAELTVLELTPVAVAAAQAPAAPQAQATQASATPAPATPAPATPAPATDPAGRSEPC